MRKLALPALLLVLSCGILTAQEQKRDDTQERFKVLEERIAALEVEVQPLRAAQAGTSRAPEPQAGTAAAPAAPAAVTATPSAPGEFGGQLPVYGGASAAAKALNPDISVIGDFLGSIGKNPLRPVPALEMHESEVGLQAIVDPYARADFFLSFGEEGVNLEEGYITFTALPGGLVARVGKMRAAFGKVNTLHNHVLPWTDRPIVTKNLVGGEDGINDAGFSVARLIPNPWIFLEATGQVFRGDSNELFKSSQRRDVSYIGHLRGYQDITDNTNVDLGFSFARGHNSSGIVNDVDLGRFRTTLYGWDATVRWRPLQRSIYHSFVASHP